MCVAAGGYHGPGHEQLGCSVNCETRTSEAPMLACQGDE